MAQHKLSKPVVYDDKEFTEINLDLDSLTGEDLVNIETEMTASGLMVALPEASKSYQMYVAARAAKVPVELIKKLSIKDASAITIKVQSFLLGTG